jgi:hypothetical protein
MLGWHSDFMITSDLLLKRFSLSMMVQRAWEVAPFLLTVVYSLIDDSDKVEFLNELLSVAPISQMQWVVLRDFNVIYEARDKSNLNLNVQLMGKFIRVLC